MTAPAYILTPNGYYFQVECDFDWNYCGLLGLRMTMVVDELYGWLKDDWGLERDEVEGNEIRIYVWHGLLMESDGRGCGDVIELDGFTLEEWLLEYEL